MKHLLALITVMLVAVSSFAATADEFFGAGRQALLRNDADKAASLLEQAVNAKPNQAEYHFWLARAYGAQARKASMFSGPGLARKTLHEFERAVELDPNYLDARLGLLEYYMQAPGFMGGSEAKARQQAEEIKKRDSLSGHRAYAIIAQRQKKPDLARKEYLEAIREQPNSPKAHHFFGTYLVVEDNFKEALQEYETVLRLDPNYMWGWFRIGQLSALMESDYTRGEEALRKYLAYQPKENEEPPHARAWYWLGLIKEKQGRKAEARQMYMTSLKLSPGAKDVMEALKRVS